MLKACREAQTDLRGSLTRADLPRRQDLGKGLGPDGSLGRGGHVSSGSVGAFYASEH